MGVIGAAIPSAMAKPQYFANPYYSYVAPSYSYVNSYSYPYASPYYHSGYAHTYPYSYVYI
ncbi:hypothetical protein ACKWTF_000944 [Chironomus riparius]